MGRVSVGGNEKGNEEKYNNQRVPKKPKISHRKPNPAANASTSVNHLAIKGGDDQNQRNRDKVQPTEARVDSESGTESLNPEFTLTDTSLLDCPICFVPLSSPVFQCENGHIACLPCCYKMAKKCPSCNLQIDIRCRAFEMILGSGKTTCRNFMYGCMEKILHSKRFDHESTCIYAPCSCPEIGCDYVGMSKCLYTHFVSQHPQNSTKFGFNRLQSIRWCARDKNTFLIEEKDNILFILNRRCVKTIGSLVNVVCVAPATTKSEYLYSLRAIRGNSTVTLETHVECVPKWTPGDPAKVCLLVPHDFAAPDGMLELLLAIRQPPIRH